MTDPRHPVICHYCRRWAVVRAEFTSIHVAIAAVMLGSPDDLSVVCKSYAVASLYNVNP